MRGKRVSKQGRAGRALSILIAGLAGYALGNWNASTPRNAGVSAAQAVALRFPQELRDASAMTDTAAAPLAAHASKSALSDAQLALLDPQPMVPQTPAPQAMAPQVLAPQPAARAALAEPAEPSRALPAAPPPSAPAAIQTSDAKLIAAAARRRAEQRPGYILNDAQIASIKERLHLTPDQEQMWPAVEAALRNLAYMRARDAHHRGTTDGSAQLASADGNGAEVQGLKSAAIPLLMSFNSEQKDEVRSLAHVMGLDQLATQF
jgi:hypothetical protein